MAEPAEPTASPPPPARPVPGARRAIRLRTVLLLLVLAALLGRGLGWFGGGHAGDAPAATGEAASGGATTEPVTGAETGTPPPAESPAAAPPPMAPLPTGPQPREPQPREPQPRELQPSEPQPAGPQPVEQAPLAGPDGSARTPSLGGDTARGSGPAPGVDPDRFASLVSLLRVRTANRELGAALAALARARNLPLDAAQRAAIVPLAADLDAAIGNVVAQLDDQVAAGRVLAARAELVLRFAAGELPEVLQRSLGLPADLAAASAVPPPPDTPWPTPAPLPRDRAVRLDGAGAREGRVAASRVAQLTVRIADARGVTFPTVPAIACEPIEATAAESLEMALVALHAGDGLLARLWLAAAGRRPGPAPDQARRDRIAALLR